MPKSKGKNAFFYFMLDYLNRETAAGRDFPNGIRDVQQDPKCSAEWQNMSKTEKGQYEARSKNGKITGQGNFEKKACDGTPLWIIEEKTRRLEEFENTMREYISSTITTAAEKNSLGKLKFIFIHVSWFCVVPKEDDSEYTPAEFAVCEFSLDEGLGKTYHEIISTKIPLGYTREALETSDKYHKIPIEFSEGEADYSVMYRRLNAFLKPHMTGNNYPPVYTAKMHAKPVRSFLNRLAATDYMSDDLIRIYSLEKLFEAIQNATAALADEPAMHFTTAEQQIEKDTFCYERNLACEFHEVIDGTPQYCSLSIVKRWGFTIADHCCESLGIDMIPGKHCPKSLNKSEIDALTRRMASVSIPKIEKVLSMTGVSPDYREKVSSETYIQEQLRHKQSKPVEIIDHSKIKPKPNEIITVIPPECSRSLREPKTMSHAVQSMLNDSAPAMDEMNFPPIGGRGNAAWRGRDRTRRSSRRDYDERHGS